MSGRPSIESRRGRVMRSITYAGDCWLWSGALKDTGYGSLVYCGRAYMAHRFAYEAFVGPLPTGRSVLHHCDRPRCCNPAHLFLGDQSDNMRDMQSKGRTGVNPGERNGRAKLSAGQVAYVKRSLGFKLKKDIAAELGVSRQLISDIASGRIWRHLREDS